MGGRRAARRDEDVARWLRWYREQGIRAIGAALLVLRRRDDDGPPRLQALEAVGRADAARRPAPRADPSRAPTSPAGPTTSSSPSACRMVDGVRVEGTTLSIVPTVGVQATVPAEHLPAWRRARRSSWGVAWSGIVRVLVAGLGPVVGG